MAGDNFPNLVKRTGIQSTVVPMNWEGKNEHSRKIKWLESAWQGIEERGAVQKAGTQLSESWISHEFLTVLWKFWVRVSDAY